MFFFGGANSRVKDGGMLPQGACPVCGAQDVLHVTIQYMSVHFFFIPLFAFGRRYIVTCGHCAAMMELNPKKGRLLERGQSVELLPEDFELLRRQTALVCPRCGAQLEEGSRFCNHCGQAL